MWGFESPPGHIIIIPIFFKLKINFFYNLLEKTKKLLRIKKAKNPLFLAYVRIHKGESNK